MLSAASTRSPRRARPRAPPPPRPPRPPPPRRARRRPRAPRRPRRPPSRRPRPPPSAWPRSPTASAAAACSPSPRSSSPWSSPRSSSRAWSAGAVARTPRRRRPTPSGRRPRRSPPATPPRRPRPRPSARRPASPRATGLTHVLDRGLSLAQVDGLVEVAGGSVDIVKLGWGTALATGNLEPKLERFRAHGIPVVLGGTLTELAIREGRVDALVDWLRELDLEHVEVSDGTITLDEREKCALIRRFASEGFTVLSEVGSKDDTKIMAPYRWVEQIEAELEAGAWKVIAEARESGTVGIFRHDGEVPMGLIDETAPAIDPARMPFEATSERQHAWLI